MADAGPRAAIWARGLGQLRHRWRSWLGLALLVGIAGGFGATTAAGARRTISVYDRLLATTNPFDVGVEPQCSDEMSVANCAEVADAAATAIANLDVVADVVTIHNFLVPIRTPEGATVQPRESGGDDCFTGAGEVDIVGSPSGRFGTEVNRRRYIEGRAADPSRRHEVTMSVTAARRADIDVGDHLAVFPIDACDAPPEAQWPPPVDVTVVGLHLAAGEVQPEAGLFLQSVAVTPPLLAELLAHDALAGPPGLAVVLRGDADEASLVKAMEREHIPAGVGLSQDDLAREVRRGLRPDATSLVLLAALGGVTALIVVGQALARQVWAGAADHPALRALGFTDRDLARTGAIEGGAIALAGAALTALVAVLASPLMPIGRARPVEPSPGVDIDGAVVGLGSLAVALVTFVITVGASRWVASRASSLAPPRTRPSIVASAVTRLGAPPSVVSGARMAFERGRGARAVPVASGLFGTGLGMAALVASLTFGACLGHLLNSPRLVGWNWDGFVFTDEEETGGPADPDAATAAIEGVVEQVIGVDGVERAGYGTFFPQFEADVLGIPGPWLMSFSTGPDAVAPTVVDGRAPAGPGEILLTRALARELDVKVGDPVTIYGQAFTDERSPPEPMSATVTLVGLGVLPVGDGLFERSVALTFDGLRRIAPHAIPQVAFIDLADEADYQAVASELGELGLAIDPDTPPPDEIDLTQLVDLDVRQADNVPRVLGTLMALLATGVLIHLVLTAIRARRGELATLQALGFRPRQIRRAVAWQATFLALSSFAIAAFVGTIVGREIWLSYAERLGVAPASVVPVAAILGFLLAFGVIANVVAALGALRLRRHSAGEVLRAE